MGSPVSLFPTYRQAENRVTNYCLLVLRLLYEENPKLLSEVLARLTGDESLGNRIGVQFQQQVRKGSSVPDGVILQPPVTIYIETKNFDWFHDGQLARHLQALHEETPGAKVLLALGPFDDHDLDGRFAHVRDLCRERFHDVTFHACTFEDFWSALESTTDSIEVSANLKGLLAEFREFLDAADLLPTWKYRLDVVNCATLPADVLDGNVYMCPATGGAYAHQRAMYFGMYRNKRVEKIARIDAVVDVLEEDTAHLRWKNVDVAETELIQRAIQKVRDLRGEYPTRVFLLGELHDTDFRRVGPPMRHTKQYFDVQKYGAQSAADLAKALHGKTW